MLPALNCDFKVQFLPLPFWTEAFLKIENKSGSLLRPCQYKRMPRTLQDGGGGGGGVMTCLLNEQDEDIARLSLPNTCAGPVADQLSDLG